MPLLRVPVLRLLRPLPLAPQGIKADMFVRDAKARCPHLTVVPYNFDAYGEDALHRDFGKKISNMLWNYCRRIDHSVGEDFQGEASQLFIVVRTHNSIIKVITFLRGNMQMPIAMYHGYIRSRGRGIRVPGCKESVLGCSSQTLLSTLSSHQL